MENKKLKQLYNALNEIKNKSLSNDLSISDADEWDDREYICFEQKIIHSDDDGFDISCLYDTHPTLRFATIQEVLSFYDGLWDIMRHGNFDENITSLDKAYNIGIYCDLLYMMKRVESEQLPQFLNHTQYKNSNAN